MIPEIVSSVALEVSEPDQAQKGVINIVKKGVGGGGLDLI